MISQLTIITRGQGLHEITDAIHGAVSKCGIAKGPCMIFLQHTSASLVVQENADLSARRDLECWLNRLVPEGDPLYTHDSGVRTICPPI